MVTLTSEVSTNQPLFNASSCGHLQKRYCQF